MQALRLRALIRVARIACAVAPLIVAASACAASEQARQADSFVESIGINAHMAFSNTVYTSSQTETWFGSLGIRYVRDGLPRQGTNALNRYNSLYSNYGIRTLMVVDISNTEAATFTNMVNDNPAFIGIEGVNEPDISHNNLFFRYNGLTDDRDKRAYPATRAFQADVAKSLDSAKVLLSPAMAHAEKTPSLLPLPNYNVRGMHSYPQGWPVSFKQSNFSSDTAEINRALGTSTPIWVTETGYSTNLGLIGAVGQAGVTLNAQAKYTNRLLAENFNNPDIDKTFLYELFDEHDDKLNYHDNFGLLAVDRTPKPSFFAVRNLIDLVEDPGADFKPGSLDYRFTGHAPGVHHTLLQKRDGTFLLLIWNDVQSQNNRTSTSPATDRNVATDNLTIHLAQQAKTINVHYNLSNDKYSTLSYTDLSDLVIAIPDDVIVVEIVMP